MAASGPSNLARSRTDGTLTARRGNWRHPTACWSREKGRKIEPRRDGGHEDVGRGGFVQGEGFLGGQSGPRDKPVTGSAVKIAPQIQASAIGFRRDIGSRRLQLNPSAQLLVNDGATALRTEAQSKAPPSIT